MRLKVFAVYTLAAAVGLPMTAAADVIDDFTFTGNGLDITFSLPASTALMYTGFGVTNYNYVYSFTGSRNGVSGPGTLLINARSDDDCNEPVEDYAVDGIGFCRGVVTPDFVSYNFYNTVFSGGVLYQYVIAAFDPGTYELTCPFDSDCPGYTLTVTPEAATLGVTPEPGTLALLSTGLAACSPVLRRRKVG